MALTLRGGQKLCKWEGWWERGDVKALSPQLWWLEGKGMRVEVRGNGQRC